jgi:hypothetical protein
LQFVTLVFQRRMNVRRNKFSIKYPGSTLGGNMYEIVLLWTYLLVVIASFKCRD